MAKVLIVEDSPTQAEMIRFLLEDVPFDVAIAPDGLEALKVLKKTPPDVVLTDLDMPRMNGLQLVEAIRRNYPTIPVVVMTALGSEEIAALALAKGAASYIPKAYLEHDVVITLERILGLTRVHRERDHAFDCLTQAEFHFVLPNDPTVVAPIIGYLGDVLAQLEICDATARMRVGVALQEAFLNAIYHGNLEVGSHLRDKDQAEYHAAVDARRGLSPYRERRVHFEANFSQEQAQYTIHDEGPGFDPTMLADPTAPENWEKASGRGLLLIRAFMDKMIHNQLGNAITLVKRRDPATHSGPGRSG